MKPANIAEGIYWVGATDWNIRDFHHVSTEKGTSYNSYLILDDKKVLIDGVKAPFCDEMLSRMKTVMDPADLDYIVLNHMEPDHSGSIESLMNLAKKATIIVSEKFGEESLARTFHRDWKVMPVKEGSELDLGHNHIRFFPISMVHWPDSMADYLVEKQIVFSNDAFGGHIASSKLFDDEHVLDEVMHEVKKYYATLLIHLSESIKRAMQKLGALPIRMIAPSHGLIWRSHIGKVLENYRLWSEGVTNEKALVLYAHMWGSTEKMARALADGLREEGIEIGVHDLCTTDRNDVMTEVLDSRALLVGSSTMHNTMLPPVASFLCQLKGLRPKGKLGVAFGSYGWGSGATRAIEQDLKLAGLEVVPTELAFKFVPTTEELERCRQFGAAIAGKIKSLASATLS